MKEQKILLVGFGRWGKIWYNTIVKYKKDLLVGIVDPLKPLDGLADGEWIIQFFKDIDDVNVEYTHAILAVPAALQLPLFEKLKKKIPAKNILVEKPVGEIENSDKGNFNGAFPGFVFLHHPIYNYIKDNIEKDVGEVIKFQSIRASMGPTLRKDCSVIEDYLVHDIYMFLDLFKKDVDRLYPTNVIRFNEFKDYLPSTIRVFGNRYPTFSMESSWNIPEKIRKWYIVGEKGSYIWDGDELFYYDSYYKEIDGKDKFNNEGYELVEGKKHQVRINTFLTPLTIQLINFLHDKTNYDDLINATWKSISSIYVVGGITPLYIKEENNES